MKIKEKIKELSKNKKVKIILAVIICFIIVFFFVSSNDEKIVNAVEKFNDDYREECIVEIKGEVNREGIYSIGNNARVNDLIILAEGLTNNADTSKINFAEKVYDGMVLYIPKIANEENSENKINLNLATKKELMTLEGIGEARALAIIEYRINSGGYKSIEELVSNKIITENVYNKIKDYITV